MDLTRPASGGLTFRFAVGTKARQIPDLQGSSYPCRRIIVITPSADFDDGANLASIYYAIGVLAAVKGRFDNELPPGTMDTINIDDASKVFFIAQNPTDLLMGRIEA